MFSDSEIETIKLARKKINSAKFSTLFSIIILIMLAVVTYTGQISINIFIGITVLFVLVAIALPQFGSGPKYADLVELLERKSNM